MARVPSIGIIGSGVSGIAAAYYAKKLGYQVEVLEASSNVGGRVGCEWLGDKRIEFGGKNIGRRYPLFRQFVADMGDFEYEFFGINTATVSDGKLRTFSSESKIKSLMNVLRLTGIRDFARLSRLILAVKNDDANGYLGGPYFSRLSRKYDSRPISAYFGERFNKRFLRPLTVRMNGAGPDEYYLGNLGSNLKMILDKYDQLKDGIYSVIDSFSDQVTVHTNTRVTSIIRRGSEVIGVNVEQGGVSKQLFYDAVVVATPAAVAQRILADAMPDVSEALSRIQYHPVGVAVVKYAEPVFDKDVRAFVFDESHELSNAGAYGINDLDIVRYTFSGPLAAKNIDEQTDPAALVALGEKYLGKLLPVSGAGREGYVSRYFRHGLCAYAPFHDELMSKIQGQLGTCSGLFLVGDYIRGAAIEACFRSAKEMSLSLSELIQGRAPVTQVEPETRPRAA